MAEPTTTCGDHRILGYYVGADGHWFCRGCHVSARDHETVDQTFLRHKREYEAKEKS